MHNFVAFGANKLLNLAHATAYPKIGSLATGALDARIHYLEILKL